MTGIGESLREVVGRLEAVGAEWAVFGGVAVRSYGTAREVPDVDLLVRADADVFAAAAAGATPLRHGAFGVGLAEAYPSPMTFTTDAGAFPFELDDDALARRRPATVEGERALLLAPEDVLVIKALMQRSAADGKHDDTDTAAILAAEGERLDWAYLRTRAGRCGGTDRVLEWLRRYGAAV
jgi:hypothetical protein